MNGLGCKYGFRYDPMHWVDNDGSLKGALVRTQVRRAPRDSDRKLVTAEVEKVLAEQRDDGSFGGDLDKTSEKLRELLKLGCETDAPRVQLAAQWMLGRLKAEPADPQKALSIAAALCLTGHGQAAEAEAILDWYRDADKDKLVKSIAATCPWSLTGRLQNLWACRRAQGMDAPLRIMIETFREGVTEAGTMCFVDTWGLLPVFGHKDCPFDREMTEHMIPRLLRSQQPDGGWRGATLDVLRVLTNHGLFDTLRSLPPLPPDWQVVRSVQLPDMDVYGLTWGDGALWVCDRAKGEAMAVSPADGSILRTVPLPKGEGPGAEIGWWEGMLVHTQGVPEPKPRKPESQKLFLIDPKTGAVAKELALDWIPRITSATQINDAEYGDKLWLCDPGEGILYYLDPRTGTHDYGPDVADSNVKRVFPADQGAWSVGWEHGLLIKSDENGWRLLDYGDMPFTGPPDYFSHPGPGYCDGLAWDGQNLWALDARSKRICLIEKTESGKDISAALALRR